jgi:hypothetical protein
MFRVARGVLAGLRTLFRRERVERDIDEELASYVDIAIERHLRAGLSREAATRAARIELGSATAVKQQVREAGWESRVDAWSMNLRDAWRALRRAPGVAVIAIGTLSLGIGGTTMMFSALDGVLLRPLPYPQPDHLVWIWGQLRGGPQRASVNPLEYRDFREQGARTVRLAVVPTEHCFGQLLRRPRRSPRVRTPSFTRRRTNRPHRCGGHQLLTVESLRQRPDPDRIGAGHRRSTSSHRRRDAGWLPAATTR